MLAINRTTLLLHGVSAQGAGRVWLAGAGSGPKSQGGVVEIVDTTQVVSVNTVKWPDDSNPPSPEFLTHADRDDPNTVSAPFGAPAYR